MPAAITLGAEGGGPETGAVCSLKVSLYHSLCRHVTSSHCPDVDEFALVLRIDGSLQTYGDEGVHRLRFMKQHRYISADIQIPAHVWQTKSEGELKSYIAHQTEVAIMASAERLKRAGSTVNDVELLREVRAALVEYLDVEIQG